MHSTGIVESFFLIFAGAAVVASIALYTRQPLLVAYIAIGAVLGPHGLQMVTDPQLLSEIGEIGIIFLLFLVGLDLPPGKLKNMAGEGLLTAIITSLNERRREMAILRAVGARPWHILLLLLSEATLLATAGVALGLGLIYLVLWIARPIVEYQFGIVIGIRPPSWYDASIAVVVIGAAFLLATGPAVRAYRNSVADGMTIKT